MAMPVTTDPLDHHSINEFEAAVNTYLIVHEVVLLDGASAPYHPWQLGCRDVKPSDLSLGSVFQSSMPSYTADNSPLNRA